MKTTTIKPAPIIRVDALTGLTHVTTERPDSSGLVLLFAELHVWRNDKKRAIVLEGTWT